MKSKNQRKSLIILVVVVTAMFAFSYAMVPLYRIFCQATGWGGATSSDQQIAPVAVVSASQSSEAADKLAVRFDANVNPDLDWTFTALQPTINADIGPVIETTYRVHNNSNHAITGIAVHNLAPSQAGAYFKRIKCFCDENKTIAAGATVDLPVQFRIDPKIKDDPDLKGVKTFTWSYTYFKAKKQK